MSDSVARSTKDFGTLRLAGGCANTKKLYELEGLLLVLTSVGSAQRTPLENFTFANE